MHDAGKAPPRGGMALFSRLDRHADRVALTDGDTGRVLTYGEMLAAGDALAAAALNAAPARPLAAVVCRNDADCVAGYVGLMRAGAAVMLLHHSLPAAHLTAVLDRFRPAVVHAPAGMAPGREAARLGGYALTVTGHATPPLHGDLALLLTTSGTTGNRDFVRLSHANIAANAHAIAGFLEIGADDRAITTLPLSYSYGLSVLHSHLHQGARLVLTESGVLSPDFWKLMREQAVTSLAGVPFVYDMLRKLRFARMDLPALRTLTQAGGRMAPDMVAEFADICAASGRRLFVMYGQTEATARISWLPWQETRRRPASIGRAIPGGRLWLEDEAGAVLDAPDAEGELVYAGDNVSLGTATGPADLARGDDNRGVLHTGDMARRDADGFFTITGRRKRFLKLYGNRVGLDELERLLEAAGLRCACTGGDDALTIHACATDADAVKAAVTAATALTPQMFRVVLVDELPRQESGKLDYAALEGRHG